MPPIKSTSLFDSRSPEHGFQGCQALAKLAQVILELVFWELNNPEKQVICSWRLELKSTDASFCCFVWVFFNLGCKAKLKAGSRSPQQRKVILCSSLCVLHNMFCFLPTPTARGPRQLFWSRATKISLFQSDLPEDKITVSRSQGQGSSFQIKPQDHVSFLHVTIS